MKRAPRSRLAVAQELLDGLNALQRAWDARWRQICEEGEVHPSQAQALLLLLEGGPGPMQDLARSLCVAASTATRIVEQMEKEGWVARSGDPQDRRRVLIHLLPAGEEAAWRLQASAREEFVSTWSQADEVLYKPFGITRLLDRVHAHCPVPAGVA